MKRKQNRLTLLLIVFLLLPGCGQVKSLFDRSPRTPVARVEDKTIPAAQGSFKVRIYTPDGSGPFPVLLYSHGGGWAAGSLDQYDRLCCYLTHTVPCVVVSVDYRLAPRYKFPVQPEDVYTALRWTRDNAQALNADPRRIAIGGDSAGGNLSAAVALMARDRGGPAVIFQLLVIPATNLVSLDAPSYRENASRSELSKTTVEMARGLYLRNTEDRYNPYASPLLARDLSRLPPALVITGEFDVVRDDGEAYAKRLQQAGVSARIVRCKGLGHMGEIWGAASEKAQEPLDAAVQGLRAAFAK
jgi:acetyl esterase